LWYDVSDLINVNVRCCLMLKLHLSIFLLGLTGVIGKYVHASPGTIVFGRTFIACVVLFLFLRIKGLPMPSRKSFLTAFPIGLLLAFHWMTFFHSVRISSVAIGLLSFSTYPVFVALLDPLFNRSAFRLCDLFFAGMIFLGLFVVVQADSEGHAVLGGVLWGILAGFTCALLTIWSKRRIREEDPIHVGMLQNFWAAVASLPFAPALIETRLLDLGLLVCLGAFCTALAHSLFIASLKTLRAQVASIALGLEPLYGILLATLLLRECPNVWEIGGGLIIITVVFLSGWTSRKAELPTMSLQKL
jgi:drug/metabolite transporter (DMT)-like permease